MREGLLFPISYNRCPPGTVIFTGWTYKRLRTFRRTTRLKRKRQPTGATQSATAHLLPITGTTAPAAIANASAVGAPRIASAPTGAFAIGTVSMGAGAVETIGTSPAAAAASAADSGGGGSSPSVGNRSPPALGASGAVFFAI